MPPHHAVRRWPAVLVLLIAVLLAVLWPPTAASACSCGPASLDDLAEREPDAAVALLRRTDDGGPARGTGAVLHRLRGDLPDVVDLQLDDGGSCDPAVAAGALATLAFRPSWGGWQTMECGEVPLEVGIADRTGPLTVDPSAEGPPAVALAGGLPGADVALLDDHLRVLAVADLGAPPGRLLRCGDDLLAEVRDERTAELRLARLDGTTLAATDELLLADGSLVPSLLDVSCAGDEVRALVMHDGAGEQLVVLRSLTGDAGEEAVMPDADGASFAGDLIVVARSARDDRPASVTAVAATTNEVVWTVPLGGIGTDAVHPSPDGRALAFGHYGENGPETVVLDAATGEERARGAAGRVPRWEGPWAGPDRLVLTPDGGTGYLEAARPLEDGLVDTDLAPVADLPALTPATLTGSEHGLLAIGGAELTVVTPAGERLVSDDLALTGAHHGLLLGPVAAAATPPDVRSAAALEARPAAATGGEVTVSPGTGPSALLVAVGGVAAAAALAAAAVRRHRASGSGRDADQDPAAAARRT